jgi:hypothetical protein
MKKIALLTIVLFLSGLGTIVAQKYKKVPFEPVKEIPEGKALVYFFRPSSMVEAVQHFSVNANDSKVSEVHLRNGTYLVYFANPGQYMFWTQIMTTKSEVLLDVKAGKTYYIEGRPGSLELVTKERGEKKIQKCKMLIEKESK